MPISIAAARRTASVADALPTKTDHIVDTDTDILDGDVSDSGSTVSVAESTITVIGGTKRRRVAKNPEPARQVASQKCSFDNSIKKICAMDHYKLVKRMGMRENARRLVDRIAQILAKKVAGVSNNLRLLDDKKTIQPKMVRCAFQSTFPGEVGAAACAAGAAAIVHYDTETAAVKGGAGAKKTDGGKIAPVRRETRAKLCLSVKTLENYLRQFDGGKWHLDHGAAVFMAGAMEYILMRIIDRAIDVRTNGRRNVCDRDVFLGVAGDVPLSNIFRVHNILIVGAGVVPGIPEILTKPPTKTASKTGRKAAAAISPVVASEDADVSDDEGETDTEVDADATSVSDVEEGEAKTNTRRAPNGRRCLQKIRRYQKTTGTLIAATCHARLVRARAQQLHPQLRFQAEAMHAIQLAHEHLLTEVLRSALSRRISLHLQTVQAEDVQGAYNAQGFITRGIMTEQDCVSALNKVFTDLMLPVAGPRKLGYRAAVKLISKEAKEEARLALISLVCEFVPTIVQVTEMRGLKTVSVKDVRQAFAMRGLNLAH